MSYLTLWSARHLFPAGPVCELDGLYAHLYGLTREELAYVLDTFPIVRRKDEERWGEYRTKRLLLGAYEKEESLTH